jgi:hypothetical protein
MSTSKRLERKCTAYHEAGHFLIYLLWNAEWAVSRVRIDINEPELTGSVEHITEAVQGRFHWQAMAGMAGACAEALLVRGYARLGECWEDGDWTDLLSDSTWDYEELASLDLTCRQWRLAARWTEKTIEHPRSRRAITALAKALLRQPTIDGRDAARIMREAWGGEWRYPLRCHDLGPEWRRRFRHPSYLRTAWPVNEQATLRRHPLPLCA